MFTIGTSPDQHIYDPVVCITGEYTHALTANGCDASEDGSGSGTPIVAGGGSFYTQQRDAEYAGGLGVASTLSARDYKEATDIVLAPRPRRLMPVECERLMSWPDGHTATGIDEQGRKYRLADTPRYKLCGNGVGSVVAEWIGRRIAAALDRGLGGR